MITNYNLSVIIPSKNEEKNIARAINSVIKNTSGVGEKEIILVDCHSTDKTIDIAKEYPVKIIQLKTEWFHSAAAARYIGGLSAKGEFIFFMDSDMALEPDFIQKAIVNITKNKRLSAIGGIGKEIYIKNGKETGANLNLYKTANKEKRVNFLGGSGLYRKDALLKSGGFNPYLSAGEENELAQRLRKNNYDLISLPIPMITHYTDDITGWNEFLRKKNAKLFFGIGQAIRLCHSLKFLFETLSYYKEFSLFLIYMFGLLTISIYALLKNPVYILIIPSITLFIFISLLFRKKSFKETMLSLVKWHILSLEIITGIISKPKNMRLYPNDPIIIKGDPDVKE